MHVRTLPTCLFESSVVGIANSSMLAAMTLTFTLLVTLSSLDVPLGLIQSGGRLIAHATFHMSVGVCI